MPPRQAIRLPKPLRALQDGTGLRIPAAGAPQAVDTVNVAGPRHGQELFVLWLSR